MAQGSNQFGVRSSRLSSILKKNGQMPRSVSCSISNRLPNNQSSASTNCLPSEESSLWNNQLSNINSILSANRLRGEESGVKHNLLPSRDSGFSCKYSHYSSSSTEESSYSSDNKQKSNSRRNNETRRKSVSFSSGSSTNLTDELLYVTDIEIDSDLETDSDPTFVKTESTSTLHGNENSDYQENSYTSRLSRGSTGGHSVRNNKTTFKRHRSADSESDGNSTMPCKYGCSASQVNVMSAIPTRSTSCNADFETDQRSVLQQQQLPGPANSTTNDGQHNFLQNLPCYSRSNFEVIRSRCHPSLHLEVDQHFYPQSSAPLHDDRRHTESRGPCPTSQEPSAVQSQTQTFTTMARSAVCNTTSNKKVDEESAVSVPRSCYTKKAMKTFLIIVMVFNIIFLAVIGFMISMLLNDHTYHECPLCNDVMNQVKMLTGGNTNYSPIQDYLKENGEGDRCCLDHALIFKLVLLCLQMIHLQMAQTNSSKQEPNQNNTRLADIIINIVGNSKEKAAIHLQSIPFNSELSGQMSDSIRWNFKDKTNVGNSWDITDDDTKIKIPLTGSTTCTQWFSICIKTLTVPNRLESMNTFEEFPLSVTLYKISHSETVTSRIGTVTLHCTFASQSIEHNSIIQKIVQLTKGDKVSLVVSNKQFLNNKQNMHQIGIFKVD